ncbi:MAG: molybdopterin-dependent oxidoreductase [Deltaproteobacteria bacterium]|nr:molybdopterin-dependent oxidoreductase [Deltaproteobacteria bacterium]
MEEITINVNGVPKRIVVDPQKTLLNVIREDLHLTGTKAGCSAGHCGTCAVIADGEVIMSCRYPIEKARDKEIITIEGIGTMEKPHPIQLAFAANGSVQCGFCTPGMIIRAKALLDKNPKPTRDDIKQAIQPHLCRCTGYEKILAAIETAAAFLRKEIKSVIPKVSKKIIGAEVARRDSLAKATGTTLYADDFPIDNCAYMKVVRSPHHHAKIVSIDSSEALAMPGVLAVFTADDVKGTNILKMAADDLPVICKGKVRMVGDPVAAVVATSDKAALDALDKVKVAYEVLPAVFTVEDALKNGAPQVHDGNSNLFFEQPIVYGDVKKGFAEADVVVEHDFATQTIEHGYLETDSGIAYVHENGQLVIMSGSQNIYQHKKTIGEAVGIGADNVRLVQTPTGGAFGGKLDVSVGGILGVAALALKRPVKLVYTRAEVFAATTKRHPFYMKAKLGVKKDGTITAYSLDCVADGGAYKSFSNSVVTRGIVHSSGPYRMKTANVVGKAVYTNSAMKGAMRGFGVPQTAFAVESLIDEAALKIGMDPFQFRKKNGFVTGDVTICAQPLTDSFGFLECLETIRPHYERAVKDAKAGSTDALKRGVGLGTVFFGPGRSAPDQSEAWAELLPDDKLQIWIGSADMGQGSDTMFWQIAAETFGYPLEKVLVCSTDTNQVPDGNYSAGSRQTYISGRAVQLVTEQLKKTMAENGCKTYADMKAKNIPTISKLIHKSTTTKLDAVDGHGTPWETYSFGVQMAEVAVDTKTGKVNVIKITAAHDPGTIINKINVDGQTWGGIVQGYGYALLEEYIYNKTDSFAKFRIPRAKDIPEIEVHFVQIPRKNGPFGASGMAEFCLVPTAPAIANAIFNACGARVCELPITAEKVKKNLP